MLVLTRRENESIMIGEDIEVKLLDIKDSQVKVGVIAPKHVAVHRREVFLAIQSENHEASQAADAETLTKLISG